MLSIVPARDWPTIKVSDITVAMEENTAKLMFRVNDTDYSAMTRFYIPKELAESSEVIVSFQYPRGYYILDPETGKRYYPC